MFAASGCICNASAVTVVGKAFLEPEHNAESISIVRPRFTDIGGHGLPAAPFEGIDAGYDASACLEPF
jgi:hypothetical protein